MPTAVKTRANLAVYIKRYARLFTYAELYYFNNDYIFNTFVDDVAGVLKLPKTIINDYLYLCKGYSLEWCRPLLWYLAVHVNSIKQQPTVDNPFFTHNTSDEFEAIFQILEVEALSQRSDEYRIQLFILTGEMAGRKVTMTMSENALSYLVRCMKYRKKARKMQITSVKDILNNRLQAVVRRKSDTLYRMDLKTVNISTHMHRWNKEIYNIRHNGQVCPITNLIDCRDCDRTVKTCSCGLISDDFPILSVDNRLK